MATILSVWTAPLLCWFWSSGSSSFVALLLLQGKRKDPRWSFAHLGQTFHLWHVRSFSALLYLHREAVRQREVKCCPRATQQVRGRARIQPSCIWFQSPHPSPLSAQVTKGGNAVSVPALNLHVKWRFKWQAAEYELPVQFTTLCVKPSLMLVLHRQK